MRVKLAFMTNDSARKRTYKKRIAGLNKKLNELSTLCGVDVGAIIYSQYEPHPQVWPNCMAFQQVLAQFIDMPEVDKSKKMVNQESYIRQMIKKADDELKKKIKENREKEMTEVMNQCLIGKMSLADFSMTNLNDIALLVDNKLSEIDSRIESLKKDPTPLSQLQKPQIMVGNQLEMMDMTQPPKSYMDLIMGSD